MDINLRQAIVNRVKGKNPEELKQVIEDSIGGDDKVLPGLGVLFEKIWEHCAPETQDQLVHNLEESLPQ